MKIKIFIGFITLVILLVAAASYSIIEFFKISSSVNALLDNNYKTIQAAKNMTEAVELQESGVLLLLMGDFKNGRHNIYVGDSTFLASLRIAKNNLTEVNEDIILDSINSNYLKLEEIIKYPIVGTIKERNIDWYNSQFHPVFFKVVHHLDDLMALNQTSMYNEAKLLEFKAKRTVMPAIVSIIAGIIFTLLFTFLINYYYLSPLKRIIHKINHNKSPNTYKLDESAIDELKELDVSIKNLISTKRTF